MTSSLQTVGVLPRPRTAPDDARPVAAAVPRPSSGRGGLLSAAASVVLLVVAVTVLARSSYVDASTGGLLPLLPPVFLVCVAALGALTVAAITVSDRSRLRPVVPMLALVASMAAAPGLLEAAPRFAAAYVHVGFTDYIARTGHTLPDLDARFSWPGFFTFAATLSQLGGLSSPLPLLKAWPVVIDLAQVGVVWVLAGELLKDTRTRWTAVLVFTLANWLGQDYFSPQSVNFLLYLVVLTVLLRYLRPAEPGRSRLAKLLSLGVRDASQVQPQHLSTGRTRALLALVLVVVTASVASHQLTPVGLFSATFVLAAVGALKPRRLPAVVALLVLGYLCYFAQPYWIGHLQTIFGSVGHVGAVAQSNVGGRTTGSTAHVGTVLVRLGFALGTGLLAVAGYLRSRFNRTATALPPLLVLAPVLIAGVQSYGGEVGLRIFLYASPFLAILVAQLLASRRTAVAAVVLAAVTATMLPLHLLARYGNEGFEQFRPDEVAAVTWVYDHAPAGSGIVSVAGNLPWQYRDIEKFRYPILDLGGLAIVTSQAPIAGSHADPGAPTYLVLTRGEELYGELNAGLPPGWTTSLASTEKAGGATVVLDLPEAQVIELTTEQVDLSQEATP